MFLIIDMAHQLTHEETDFKSQNFPLALVTHQLRSPANLGSIYRLAEAFHIEQLFCCGNTIDLNSNRLKRTARATVTKVKTQFFDDTTEALQVLKEQNYRLIGLEITDNSIALQDLQIKSKQKIALVIGDERMGIDSESLSFCNTLAHINMFGDNSSMNVAQATAIALYEITKKMSN